MYLTHQQKNGLNIAIRKRAPTLEREDLEEDKIMHNEILAKEINIGLSCSTSLYSVRLPTIDAQYILCIDDLIISHLSERMVYSVIVKEKRKENTRMCQSHNQRVIMLVWIIRLKDRLILLATNILTLVERLLAPFSKC